MKSFEHEEFSRKRFALIVKGQTNAKYLFNLLDDKPIKGLLQRDVLRDYERYGLEL